MELSYFLGNGNSEKIPYTSGKAYIGSPGITKVSYTSGKVFSEP